MAMKEKARETVERGRARTAEGARAAVTTTQEAVLRAAERAKGLTPAARRVRRRKERRRDRIRGAFTGAGLGFALAYFLDPDNGRRRRAIARDRIQALIRRSTRKGERLARYAAGETYGAWQKVRHSGPDEPPPNDATLARKVESEVLGNSPYKGRVNINAEEGVVAVRGEVERPEDVLELEGMIRRVDGVRDVRNLLHLPGTPAPSAPGS